MTNSEDDLFDLETLPGRLLACLVAGFLCVALGVIVSMFDPEGSGRTTTGTERVFVALGLAVWLISSSVVLVAWVVARIPRWRDDDRY